MLVENNYIVLIMSLSPKVQTAQNLYYKAKGGVGKPINKVKKTKKAKKVPLDPYDFPTKKKKKQKVDHFLAVNILKANVTISRNVRIKLSDFKGKGHKLLDILELSKDVLQKWVGYKRPILQKASSTRLSHYPSMQDVIESYFKEGTARLIEDSEFQLPLNVHSLAEDSKKLFDTYSDDASLPRDDVSSPRDDVSSPRDSRFDSFMHSRKSSFEMFSHLNPEWVGQVGVFGSFMKLPTHSMDDESESSVGATSDSSYSTRSQHDKSEQDMRPNHDKSEQDMRPNLDKSEQDMLPNNDNIEHPNAAHGSNVDSRRSSNLSFVTCRELSEEEFRSINESFNNRYCNYNLSKYSNKFERSKNQNVKRTVSFAENPSTSKSEMNDSSLDSSVKKTDSPKRTSPLGGDDLRKIQHDYKKAQVEIASLKAENSQLKDEGVRLRKVAINDTVMSTPSHVTDASTGRVNAFPPVVYIIAAIILGLIVGKFIL